MHSFSQKMSSLLNKCAHLEQYIACVSRFFRPVIRLGWLKNYDAANVLDYTDTWECTRKPNSEVFFGFFFKNETAYSP